MFSNLERVWHSGIQLPDAPVKAQMSLIRSHELEAPALAEAAPLRSRMKKKKKEAIAQRYGRAAQCAAVRRFDTQLAEY